MRNAIKTRTILLLTLSFSLGTAMAPVERLAAQDAEGAAVFVVDPLTKVMRGSVDFYPTEAHADVARGEHASFQLVVRGALTLSDLSVQVGSFSSGTETLPAAEIGYVGYVHVGRSTPNPSRDRIPSPSGFYPDPILPEPPQTVEPMVNQPIWISVPVPLDAVPGTYSAPAAVAGRVGGEAFEIETVLTIEVFSVAVDESTLWVTNWFSMGDRTLERLNGGEPVEPDSDRYWALVRELARSMAAYRQNVALLSPLRLAEYRLEGEELEIDFSRFDRAVEIFIEEGVIGRIEGGHIGTRSSNWTSPFVVHVPVVEPDTVTWARLPINGEQAASFYNQFLPALAAHLEEKGWEDRYLQHIADEPISENVESYIEISRFVKDLWPGVKIIEAVHSRDVADVVDVWVPQLNFAHEDYAFYRSRQDQGDEFWTYTCLAPQGEYANRFIELPLIKTRVLHWINYRYGITGYLHWGLNHWRTQDPFVETTGINLESGNVLPGGDAWIVYPGDGEVLPSIRAEAMRDGIVDYELLRRAEVLAPEEIAELARHVVYQFDRYDMSVPAFREKRRHLLQLLSDRP